MCEFNISFRSFEEIRAFVSIAMVQPFGVLVENGTQQVNGKSFMGMFSLDHGKPVRVLVDCEEEESRSFRQQTACFQTT